MAPGRPLRRTIVQSQSEVVGNSETEYLGCNPESSSSRKGRGKGKNVSLTKMVQAIGKLKVQIPQGRTRPPGVIGKLFVNEIGIICRTYAPLTCHNWRSVKQPQRKIFHARIMEKFDIDIHKAHVLTALDRYLGRRFKEYRCKLHAHYKRLRGTHEQKKQKPHKDVSQEDWESMCDWFENDAFKKVSRQNSANRRMNKTNHRAGSKPFICYRDEERDAETQREVGRIELYRITHFNQKNGWSSHVAEQKYMEMIALQSQPTAEGFIPLTEDQIANQVLGTRSGYIFGLGHGVVPSSASSSSSNSEEVIALTKRVEEAEKHSQELDRKMEEMEAWKRGMESQFHAFMMSQSRDDNCSRYINRYHQ